MSATGPPPRSCEIAVVGAGIVGLATARELARRHPAARVVVLEREPGPARHQSGHSSGVIHSGIYYEPGSLKARLCVDGAARLYAYCAERGIEARREGKVIVATDAGELGRLDELERRGRANGVPGLRRVDREGLRELEPHARGVAALHSPATGVVDFAAVAAAFAADLDDAGGTLHVGTEVRALASEAGGGTRIEHGSGTTVARRLVVCAGPWADRLARAAGGGADPRIVPFRGAYMRLRPERSALVRASIYPVPDPDLPFLGTHITRTIDGEVLLGPTALFVGARDAYRLRTLRTRDLRESLGWPGTWRLFARHWRTGAAEIARALSRTAFVASCRRLLPELRSGDVERSAHAGVRAQAVARDGALIDDFLVAATDRAVHVRNAPSPAATASLALAEEIADRLEALG